MTDNKNVPVKTDEVKAPEVKKEEKKVEAVAATK